jgi:hypothetical protein
VIPFTQADEEAIRDGARRLEAGRPTDLPPRHVVSAAHYALERGRMPTERLVRRVTDELNTTAQNPSTRSRHTAPLRLVA